MLSIAACRIIFVWLVGSTTTSMATATRKIGHRDHRRPAINYYRSGLPGELFTTVEVAEAMETSPATIRRLATSDSDLAASWPKRPRSAPRCGQTLCLGGSKPPTTRSRLRRERNRGRGQFRLGSPTAPRASGRTEGPRAGCAPATSHWDGLARSSKAHRLHQRESRADGCHRDAAGRGRRSHP